VSGVLVITSCSATKVDTADGPVTAESLYAGRQHRLLMGGVREYRAAGQPAGPLELHIVSAGHGVVDAARPLDSYEETFAGLPADAIRRRAAHLGIPDAVRTLLAAPRSLALLLLGDDYLRACALDEHVTLGAPTVALCSPATALRLPTLEALRPVPLVNADARRFGAPLVALKGALAGRLLGELAAGRQPLGAFTDPARDVLDALDTPDAAARAR
jgi:hypothetical protein